MASARHAQTIVVKVGTSTLTAGTSCLSKPVMLEIIRQIVGLQRQDHRVVLVSSGAIAAGREMLSFPDVPTHLPAKQMLSAVGQGHLIEVYSTLFGLYDVRIGQVLLTHGDFMHRTRYLNARDTLNTLLDYGIVPVVNENDTVAVEEIKLGDNDNLSAQIAVLLNASLLIILTDQDGLYDRDPRMHRDARLIETVDAIDDVIAAHARGTHSALGVGGMTTKIQAAQLATRSGTRVIITNGRTPNVLLRLVSGEALGTVFRPLVGHIESRKRWLLAERPQGALVVDKGAAKVLREQGASLLPVGIRTLEGEFERGAVVLVVDESQRSVAQGLVNYPSADLLQLCGVHTEDIEGILGYTYGEEAIHRDNMVLI